MVKFLFIYELLIEVITSSDVPYASEKCNIDINRRYLITTLRTSWKVLKGKRKICECKNYATRLRDEDERLVQVLT